MEYTVFCLKNQVKDCVARGAVCLRLMLHKKAVLSTDHPRNGMMDKPDRLLQVMGVGEALHDLEQSLSLDFCAFALADSEKVCSAARKPLRLPRQ
jgi:hypothetical protein